MNWATTLSALLFLIVLQSCSSTNKLSETSEPPISKTPMFSKTHGGSSGMEKIGQGEYITVYDLKNFQSGPRIGMIIVTDSSFIVKPITVNNWEVFGSLSSDLESISAVPGRSKEYLAAESGNWQGKLGRIFHLKINMETLTAEIMGVFQLPMNYRNDFGMVGDQNEGLVCLEQNGDYYAILGERGGSESYPSGLITWAMLDFENYTLKYTTKGKSGITINSSFLSLPSSNKRDITDFHLDQNQILWVSSSVDSGDLGPFDSEISQLGKVSFESGQLKIQSIKNSSVIKIPGYKIEALSGVPDFLDCECLSFGSEDELLGGSWRVISSPMKN